MSRCHREPYKNVYHRELKRQIGGNVEGNRARKEVCGNTTLTYIKLDDYTSVEHRRDTQW